MGPGDQWEGIGRLFPVGNSSSSSPAHAWTKFLYRKKSICIMIQCKCHLNFCGLYFWVLTNKDGNIILWKFTKHGMSEQQSTFQVRAETSQVSYATAFLLFAAATEGNKRANGRLPETERMQRLCGRWWFRRSCRVPESCRKLLPGILFTRRSIKVIFDDQNHYFCILKSLVLTL